MATKANDRRTIEDELNERISELSAQCELKSWNELVDTVSLPNDMAIAIATGRVEMIKLVQPRELSQKECASLIHLIGVLLQTNEALRTHAAVVGSLAEDWQSTFKGLHRIGNRIAHFANFRRTDEADEDESS